MPLCPHCQRPLPDPPERFCPHCGGELLAAVPAGTPWEQRGRIGFVSALVETTQGVLARPAAFFRAMPVTGGLGGPLLYAVIIGYVGILAGTVYAAILKAVAGPSLFGLSQHGEFDRFLPYLQGGMSLVFQAVFGPVLVAVCLFLAAAIGHLFLLLLGGARQGFEATFRVACYAEAAALLQIIPLCGSPIASAYFLVLAIIGLSEAHGIGRGKAAAAVLLPLFLVCCCCAAGIALMAGGLVSALGNLK
jgi:hypothetical protein